MIETIIFNNEVLEFEIPNNLNELKLLKIQLETQLSLLQESLKHSRSPDQTRRIEKTEIAPIKAQVKAVNLAIQRFYSLEKKARIEAAKHQPKSLKEFKGEYRQMLTELEQEPYPDHKDDRSKLLWIMSQWRIAMDLLLNEDLSDEERKQRLLILKRQFSAANKQVKKEILNAQFETKRAMVLIEELKKAQN